MFNKMKLEFDKYLGDSGRSLDINIYGLTEKAVETMADLLENQIEDLNFLYDTVCEIEASKFNIIGTVEYQHGSMAELKQEITATFKELKKSS